MGSSGAPAFEEARRWAEKAVHLAPTNPQANQSLAFVLAVTGEAEQAIRVAQRAIELNSNYAEHPKAARWCPDSPRLPMGAGRS